MTNKNKLVSVLVIWFLQTIGLVGCTMLESNPNALVVQMPSEPASLDFSLIEDGASFRVMSALMSGLVKYERDYSLSPQIAQSIEVLDEGKKYRFKLKPWKWSDGKSVSAEDFVYALRRTLDPTTPSKLAEFLFFVKGAKEFKQGKLKDFSAVGIKAYASENILEFLLDRPVRFFPHILTLSIGMPQRKDIFEKYGSRWVEHMETTGPYRIAKWIKDQKLELVRNPYFPFPVKDAAQDATGLSPLNNPEVIIFQFVAEESTALTLFEKGKLDILSKVSSMDIDRLRKSGLAQAFPYFATYYIGFNQKVKPWNDRKARLAVAQAIDRKAILDSLNSTDRVAMSWVPESLPGNNLTIGVPYNPVSAKELWMQSQGKSVKGTLLGFDSGARNQIIVEKIQADLKTNLGLRVELRNRDWKTYLRELVTDTPALFRFGWLSPFVDAYADLMLFKSGNPNNYTGWSSKNYDMLLDEIAKTEPGSVSRQALIDRAQRLLLEQAIVVPIYHYTQTLAVSKRVKNLWVSGTGTIDWTKIQLGKF